MCQQLRKSDRMNDEPNVSDRLQYVIGTLISVVLLSMYLIFSDDHDEQSSADPAVTEQTEVKK